MLLAIDTGNTHTVIGLISDKMEIVNSFRLPTDHKETDCGYAIKIDHLLRLNNVEISDIEDSIISSVAPRVTRELVKAIKMLTGKSPLVVGTFDSGLDLTSIPGGVIAPDLEVAAVAAKELYPLPCIIVDMGTATTVTVVDKDGAYIGGAILPGSVTSLNALVAGTSLLPAIDIVAPNKSIAVDTIPSMQSGLVYGSAGAIDGIIDHFMEEMETVPASIVTTGGLGKLICRYCRHEMEFDDDLLLKGMYLIWKSTK